MGPQITIRAAVRGDEAQLAALSTSVQELHFAERPDVFKPAQAPELESWFAEQLRAPQPHIWIAQIGELVVGYALTNDEGRGENVYAYARCWREVVQVGVHPHYRRRGVAAALLRHVAAAAKADGISTLELNTWTFNSIGREAFEHLGFVAKNVRYELPTESSGGRRPTGRCT